ncbi:MAG: hypothetical protein NDJ89_00960 [Oligoflexia bacterium]|nr:hypothetical protein [Oligoflexia bacterium]
MRFEPLFAIPILGMLLFGVLGGLGRLGALATWGLPPVSIGLHGPLMVLGFLGTVIAIERAKALGRFWGYLAPAGNIAGVALLLAGSPVAAPALLLSNAIFVAILGHFFRLQPALHSAALAGAAVLLLAGNAVYFMTGAVPQAVPWWMAFLALTIAGERLELGRLLRLSARARGAFVLFASLLPLGAAWNLLAAPASADALASPALALFGAGLLGLSIWLLLNDVARRTVRFAGLPRFIAICLISGNAWLGISGGLMLFFGLGGGAGPVYDAVLHALFVGFVFSMIFGHAPVILPAVAKITVPFRSYFYGHLALLHLSLVLRLAGDFGGAGELRYWGAALNGIALVFFFLATAASALRGVRPKILQTPDNRGGIVR